MQQDALGWSNPNCLKHISVSHGQDNGFDQFLNLLVGTSNVRVFLRGSLIDFHGLNSRIEFRRKLFQNQIGIFVCSHQVTGFEFVRIHQTRNGQKDRLSRGSPNNGTSGFAVGIRVEGVTGFFFFLFETVFGIGFQDFHHVRHQVGQLFVDLDLFLVFTDSIALSTRFVCDSLDVRFHHPNVVAQQVDSLTQFSGAHGSCLLVLRIRFHGDVFFRFFLGFLASAGGVSPNIVTLQIVAHGCEIEMSFQELVTVVEQIRK
mmetsp:Transcript_3584/g.8555  ORF Transcript_3584/g.8555 Transcript_3584/m.8555 type:complete len:259 (-) Transcript_3584:84-860(-)